MKKCIYVVEDNTNLREIIEFLLVEERYTVKACPTLKLFWQQMQQQLPDMVVLDVILPDGNGMDVCSQLKHNSKTYQIPVLMMSANNHLSKVKGNCEAESYLNKPFDINDFMSRIVHYVPV